MIELRWIKRPLAVLTKPLPEGMTASIPEVRVLQYRTAQTVFDCNANPTGERRWSDWTDVPEVSEGTT